ncbi:MAG: hypothetical protein HRF52_14725 [Ignavibacterium sp.]|jgi:hypothetical protein|uniref:hypothetical protein n=1 Tax=Ignavibacterium sp. TaxID=2651167 RepID=UPI00329918CD
MTTYTVLQEDINQVRRMVNEPTIFSGFTPGSGYTDTAYSDLDIAIYLGKYNNDVNAVASIIWMEKAATLQATAYDVSADGANYALSQKIENAQKLAKYYASKRKPTTSLWVKDPEESDVESF